MAPIYPFPRYREFTDFTPVIPELYWNVYSSEERIRALCWEWVKLTAYVDDMSKTVNDQYDIIKDMQERLPELVNDSVYQELQALIDSGAFDEILNRVATEYWSQYESRIVGVETGLSTLNSELTTERNARIAADEDIRSDFAADLSDETQARITADENIRSDFASNLSDEIAAVNATISADVDRLELQDEGLSARIESKASISTYNEDIYDYNNHQNTFIYGELYNPNKFALNVTDENNFKDSFDPSIYNYGCQSNIDICASIAIANTYLANADKLYYANSYTGVDYEGDFNSPTRVDPRNHKNELGQMPIDCNAFTQLVGHGVRYNSSTYAANVSGATIGLHPMFKDNSQIVKQYWSYNGARDGHDTPFGYGRMLSDAFAKYLFDCGKLEIFPTGAAEALVPGKIYFSGDTEIQNNRFLGITHCFIVTGLLSQTAATKIISHATSARGLSSQRLTDTNQLTHTVAAFTPNYSAGAYLALANADRAVYRNNINLSSDPINFDFETMSSTPQYGARVVSLCTASGGTAQITITATNKTYTSEQITVTRVITGAPTNIYLPLGYDIEITSTSSTLINIVLQTCSTDRNIILARPSN